MNKTVPSAAQIAKFTDNCSFSPQVHKQKLYIGYLTSWHDSIFGYKLRTIEAKNP